MNPLVKLEQPLIDLKTMACLLEHMATSDRTANDSGTGQELWHIKLVLQECHEDLHAWWENALHENKAEEHDKEVAALEAELAACKASQAAPGSQADVENAKAYWMLMLSAARSMLDACAAAGLPVQKPEGEAGGE